MPSIPQSLLWISLVVLWLFVLVPMLINKRDTVRRTSDVALSTRVLNSGANRGCCGARGPAAGHRHDPDWRPETSTSTRTTRTSSPRTTTKRSASHAGGCLRTGAARPARSMVVAAVNASEANTEPVYLDVDVVDENSGALPVGDRGAGAIGVAAESLFEQPRPARSGVELIADAESTSRRRRAEPRRHRAESRRREHRSRDCDEYEYVEDTSGLEAEDESDTPEAPPLQSSPADGVDRRRGDRAQVPLPQAGADRDGRDHGAHRRAVVHRRAPSCGGPAAATAAVTVLYLAYLRRQTRIEEQVRRRRQQRMARSRMAGERFGERASDGGGVDVECPPGCAARRGGAGHRRRGSGLRASRRDALQPPRFDLPRAAGQ